MSDHRRLHSLLDAARCDGTLHTPAYDELRAGLLRHIAIEEKLLLPAARRARGGEPLARAHALRIEHAALTSLLVPTPTVALCAELDSLLATHDAKEEGPDGIYAECEALLTEAESAALADAADAYPPVPLARHFDGPGALRTAEEALASAQRLRRKRAGGAL